MLLEWIPSWIFINFCSYSCLLSFNFCFRPCFAGCTSAEAVLSVPSPRPKHCSNIQTPTVWQTLLAELCTTMITGQQGTWYQVCTNPKQTHDSACLPCPRPPWTESPSGCLWLQLFGVHPANLLRTDCISGWPPVSHYTSPVLLPWLWSNQLQLCWPLSHYQLSFDAPESGDSVSP